MKANKLIRIGDAIEVIGDQTETSVRDIIAALTGVCFDEEDAGELRQYNEDEDEKDI